MRRILHLTVLGVLWLLAAIAIAIFALQWFLPNTGLAMFSHTLSPWLLGPLLIALGYTFYTAQPKIALGITVAIALTAYSIIPTFLPRFEDTPNIIFKLRVMSFNTWISNPSTDLPSIAEVIANENPDVIALQEVDSDILAELKVHLDERRPGQFAFMLGDPITEQAFISRYPLTLVGTENDHSRVFKVTALTPEGEVALWSVHAYRTNLLGGRNFLSYRNPRMHRTPDEQFGWLAEQIKEVSGPLIVMGDFNLPYQAAPLQNLKLKEAHQEAGWLFDFTFPASNKHSRQISVFGDSVPVSSPIPLVRLDHIFYNYRWYATRAESLSDSAGSDHAPVMADLGLQP
jgi:endonuclease/exonuclease/phosphatase (EEP) superfamily protein YafD